MFTPLLLVLAAFVAGVMTEKYLDDVFAYGRTPESVYGYLKAATVELFLDIVTLVRVKLGR